MRKQKTELKTPKVVMRELLSMSLTDRAAKEAADGFDQVAALYLNEAIEQKDPAMLKYIIEMVDEKAPKESAEVSKDKILSNFSSMVDDGIDEDE